MAASDDFVTTGCGHNGLIAAAYVAAAGKRVLVSERPMMAVFADGAIDLHDLERRVPGLDPVVTTAAAAAAQA